MTIASGNQLQKSLAFNLGKIKPNYTLITLGDVILGVNGDSFTDMGHHDAVKYLSALRGTIRFDLENAIEADIDEVCDMDTRFYQFHIAETEQSSSEAVQTKTLPGVNIFSSNCTTIM